VAPVGSDVRTAAGEVDPAVRLGQSGGPTTSLIAPVRVSTLRIASVKFGSVEPEAHSSQ
jgi:hypothetical protein